MSDSKRDGRLLEILLDALEAGNEALASSRFTHVVEWWQRLVDSEELDEHVRVLLRVTPRARVRLEQALVRQHGPTAVAHAAARVLGREAACNALTGSLASSLEHDVGDEE